jgi:small subunit ribosomal protein S6
LNTYESMYILQTNLSDEENQKANRRIVEEIEKRGGSMHHRERLGKKRLAYRIGKQDDGVYHLMYFELPPGEVASLRAAYKLHPRLLRIMILRKEPEDIPKLQKRGPKEAGRHDEEGSEAGDESAEEKAGSADDEPEKDEGDSDADTPPDEEEAPAGDDEDVEPKEQE